MDVLSWLPTVVIIGCEVAALVMIIIRASGTPRTLGAIGVVALLVRTLLGFGFGLATSVLYEAGAAVFGAVLSLRSAVSTSLGFIGIGLLGAAGILASRRTR